MAQTIEQQEAVQIAHREHIAKVLERTGGEIMHPDHYDLRMTLRDAVLEAMDAACDEQGIQNKVLDKDLPALFVALDALSEKLFLRSCGLDA